MNCSLGKVFLRLSSLRGTWTIIISSEDLIFPCEEIITGLLAFEKLFGLYRFSKEFPTLINLDFITGRRLEVLVCVEGRFEFLSPAPLVNWNWAAWSSSGLLPLASRPLYWRVSLSHNFAQSLTSYSWHLEDTPRSEDSMELSSRLPLICLPQRSLLAERAHCPSDSSESIILCRRCAERLKLTLSALGSSEWSFLVPAVSFLELLPASDSRIFLHEMYSKWGFDLKRGEWCWSPPFGFCKFWGDGLGSFAEETQDFLCRVRVSREVKWTWIFWGFWPAFGADFVDQCVLRVCKSPYRYLQTLPRQHI